MFILACMSLILGGLGTFSAGVWLLVFVSFFSLFDLVFLNFDSHFALRDFFSSNLTLIKSSLR